MKTVAAFKVDSYPDYYVIDRAGNLRMADLAKAELDRVVEALVKNLLLAWPLIWSVLSPIGPLWKMAVSVTLGLLVTATELPAAESFLGKGPDEFFWLINFPQLAMLLTYLIATRWLGYRLIRQRDPA